MKIRIKFLLVSALSLVNCITCNAQTIKGKVIDENNNPVGCANIMLIKNDSSFVKGCVSGQNGTFTILLQNNDILKNGLLKVSYVGYNDTYINLTGNPLIGNIKIYPNINTLKGVVIKGNKPLFSVKGAAIIANISGTTLGKEIDIKDLLRKIPGMIVEKGELTSVNGTPIYYINNRKVESFNEVSQLEIKNIDRIEVNTNPGAEYDASVGTVVKIYLKKRENGWSAQMSGDYQRNHKNNNHESIHLNYQHDGLNIFGTLGYGDDRGKSYQHIVTDIATQDTLWEQNTLLVRKYASQKDYSYSMGINYMPDKKYNLGVKYDGDYQKMYDISPSNTGLYANSGLYTDLTSVSNLRDKDHNHHINIYMNDNIGKQSSLEVYADYVNKSSGRKQDVNEKSDKYGLDETNSSNHANYNLYACNTTYSHTINVHNSYVTGIEISSVSGNSILNYQNNKLQGNKSRTLENRLAFFASYNLKLKKFSINTGLRYERVYSKYADCLDGSNDIKRHYNNLFPSLNITYSMHNGLTHNLSYRSSIIRPNFGKLNNYSYYLDRFQYQEGNPNLQPEISQTLQYNIMYKFLVLSLRYKYNKDFIGTYFYTLPSDSTTYIDTWKNFNKQQQMQVIINAQKRWNIYEPSITAMFMKNIITVPFLNKNERIDKPTWYVDFNNYLHLSNNFLVDLEYNYISKCAIQYFIFKPKHIFNMSVKKSFMKDNLSVNLSVEDIFRKDIDRYRGNIGNITFSQREDEDRRNISISIVWNFNNYKNNYHGDNAAKDVINRL